MSQIDEIKKDEFVDSFLDQYNKLRDAMDSRVKDVTIADLPKKAREQLVANVDTKIIVANMLTAHIAELEAANPMHVKELRVATDDIRVIMMDEGDRRVQWIEDKREATRKLASGIG